VNYSERMKAEISFSENCREDDGDYTPLGDQKIRRSRKEREKLKAPEVNTNSFGKDLESGSVLLDDEASSYI